MQSFGDDTLLACIDAEKRHRGQAGCEAPLREGNVSDRGKYFESCSLLSGFASDANDVDKPRPPEAKGTGVTNAPGLAEYFEDSIIFPKISGRRNLAPASGAPKGNTGLSQPSQRNRSKPSKESRGLKGERRPGTTNDTEKCDGSGIQGLCKNISPDNAQDATSSSGIKTSSAVNDTENSEFIISSPPLCTQDRCKLSLWGLPPNVLQVLYL